jgi:hypothetical protein
MTRSSTTFANPTRVPAHHCAWTAVAMIRVLDGVGIGDAFDSIVQ